MILLLDNYDSFTFNLAQYLGELGAPPLVRRNDENTLDEVRGLRPERIVISPGPGRPEDAGITVELIREMGQSVPLLGVCLGHQGIGLAFGGSIVRAPVPMHGKVSSIEHDGKGLFRGISSPFLAGRYHSWIVSKENFPEELEITAEDENGFIMALQHKKFDIQGVQFHPESVLTPFGEKIMRNWLCER